MSIPLNASRMFLGCSFATKEDVIRAIGGAMVAAGDVTPRYVEGMLEKEAEFSTWITDGVALPHGTNAVKNEILRSSVSVAQIPRGVPWGGGRLVRLAIGIAGKGDQQHLELLASLAGVLQDKAAVEILMKTMDQEEVVRILQGEKQ